MIKLVCNHRLCLHHAHAYPLYKCDKMAEMLNRQVTFSKSVSCFSDNKSEDEDSNSEEFFHELTTSEAESVEATSDDDEDGLKLDMLIQGAYSCNPAYFSSFASEAAQRNSLLLFDKDLRGSSESGMAAVCIVLVLLYIWYS